MGYYIEIQPRDRSPVSVNTMKERLLALGLEPHPALVNPDTPPEEKEKFKDDLIYSGGLLSVEETDRSPAQVRVVARAS